MTDPLFRWLCYRDRFPLAHPELLGELTAPTLAAAKNLAAERFPGIAVVIQSAASHRVRPVTALPLEVKQPVNSPVSPRKQRDYRRSKSKQQLDAFCAQKRAAHAGAKRDIGAVRPTTGEA